MADSTACINVVILGSTGSIGTQAFDVIRAHPHRFRVVGVAAGGNNVDLLARQVAEFQIMHVAVPHAEAQNAFLDAWRGLSASGLAAPGSHVEPGSSAPGGGVVAQSFTPDVQAGPDAIEQLAGSFPDAIVLNGITGGVGLRPTLAALRAGSQVALANKESLVVGGPLVQKAMVRSGQIVPVDSEHSAIAQCLLSGVHEKGLVSPVVSGISEVDTLVLTASGGPFRGKKRSDLRDVTAAQALDHPTWNMGPVVTINSSTLVNKGLELIEAFYLFDIAPADIETVVHPQSIIHSMVTWRDGATVAQASPPDMHLPIALGMTWPERLPKVETPLNWRNAQSWTFEPVDNVTFPAIALARQAIAASPTHATVYNAANEVFVDAFIRGELPYLDIVDNVDRVLQLHDGIADPTLDEVLTTEAWAVARCHEIVKERR